MPALTDMPASAAVARAWLDDVADRDLERVRGLLAPDVWFRVLLPRDVVEAHEDVAADGRVRRIDLVCTGFHPTI